MFDLSKHAILPQEDFQELVLTAFNQPTPTLGERTGTVVQTTLICSALAGAFIAATHYWRKEMSKLEDKKLENKIAEAKLVADLRTKKQ